MTNILRTAGFTLAFGNMAILFPAPSIHDFQGFLWAMLVGLTLVFVTENPQMNGI